MGWGRYFRKSRDEDLSREIESYLAHEIDLNLARGMTDDEARQAARRKFGNTTLVHEAVFEMNRLRLFELAWRDVKYGVRQLRLNPVYAVTAILSLALGIGANTAVFTLLHASLWKPLPVKDPHQIVHLVRGTPGSEPDRESSSSYVLFQQLGEAARPFGEVVARTGFGLRKFGVGNDSNERVVGEAVSGNFFAALRVVPAIGRLLEPQDDRTIGGERVAVLSHAFWTRRFESNPSVLGKTVQYKETPYRVVGVAQAGFTGVEAEASIDVWVPIAADADPGWLNRAHTSWLQLLMRVHPSAGVADVQGTLDGVFRAHVAREIVPTAPAHFRPALEAQHLRLRPADAGMSSTGRRYEKPLLLLLAVVALVLLICCANVANLVMARNAARAHEIALRLAIGASRGRIVSQLFIESLMLAASGAACGVLLAIWACDMVIAMLPQTQVPFAFDLRSDATVLGFTAAIAAATAMLFGLVPALRGSFGGGRSFASGRRITERSMAGQALVASQLALSLLLLVAAGLFLQTIGHLRAIDLGFRPQNLVTFDLSFPRGTPAERVGQAYRQIQERLALRPGVTAVSYSMPGLYEAGGWSGPMELEERRAAPGEDNEVALMAVGPDFFRTIGLELLQGRELTASDRNGPGVAVVNASLARQYFGGTSPVGRRIKLPGLQPELREIVGVARDARHFGARGRVWPQIYLPGAMPGSALVVRSAGDLRLLGPFIREAATAVDSAAQVERLQQLDDIVERSFSRERLIATLSTAFAILAAVLAAVGLYGVMAYNVARRTSELGVRMALGAGRHHIQWLVLRRALQVLLAGAAIGIGGALASTRFASSLLYGVEPTDYPTFARATALLIAVALVAGLLPARRASRIDPIQALRHE